MKKMTAMRPTLIIVSLLILGNTGWIKAEESNNTLWKGFSISCVTDEKGELDIGSVSCHGIRLVRKIVQKMLEDTRKKKSLEILDGISLVEKEGGEETSSRNGRALKETFGPLSTIARWFETRELRIKLPSLMPKNLEAAIEESLPSSDAGIGRGGGGGGIGGGGGKKGDGYMLMALMMGKTMAAMGFGALALLSMKALMVSALALMLSLIVAAKKLAGGKEEEGHHIVYAQEVSSHHRKRRSIDEHWQSEDLKNHPYRGYSLLSPVMS